MELMTLVNPNIAEKDPSYKLYPFISTITIMDTKYGGIDAPDMYIDSIYALLSNTHRGVHRYSRSSSAHICRISPSVNVSHSISGARHSARRQVKAEEIYL